MKSKLFRLVCLIGLLFCMLLANSCGKGSLSKAILNASITVKTDQSDLVIHYIDRKITGVKLDVSKTGEASLIFSVMDTLQINNKIYEIPYVISLTIPENSNFIIVRSK